MLIVNLVLYSDTLYCEFPKAFPLADAEEELSHDNSHMRFYLYVFFLRPARDAREATPDTFPFCTVILRTTGRRRFMLYAMALHLLVTLTIIGFSYALVDYPSTIVPIRTLFNNQAASSDGSADFDGLGSCFDSKQLPHGPWLSDGISYDLPSVWGEGNDNVIASGQALSLEQPTFAHELHFLYSGDASGGEFVANFVLTFTDNSTQLVQMYARNWWKWPLLNNGAIQTAYHFENNGMQKNFNTSQIYQWSTSVLSEHALKTITLPPMNTKHRLHVFAMSLSPSTIFENNVSSPALSVRRARFTSRWEMINGERAQAVEVTLANLLPAFLLSFGSSITSRHEITIRGAGIETLSSGFVYRLVPGDQARVDVFVIGSPNDGRASVHIQDSQGREIGSSDGWTTSSLIENWTPDPKVLSIHETPSWWNKAKFGIFIHWGIYSYPAWAPSGTYAEWYDWDLHSPDSPTWNHHLETFGKDVVYDNFIANFTAAKFNASEWVDLFDKAGAKYFVFVSKHHDGFALFDTGNTTHRSSVHLGPKRDFLSELLDTAKRERPNLHRGTYYSLPEWYNPDYAKYGFGSWPGGLAHNAFNISELESYTGRLAIDDYLTDVQLPHMLDLALKYETEIMWCDIGGSNRTIEFAAQFYDHAFKNGRQVTINNRCGAVPDFDTPEYATFGSTQTQPWESSEGMDPFSYGLNLATQANQYKNGTTIIQTLVDIVSKNGNFLLDVGPTAEGDCIYDTEYWFPSSQELQPEQSIRFTTTPKTFCIITFSRPQNGQVAIQKRVPILQGDEIRLLDPDGKRHALKWSVDNESGQLIIDVSESELASGRYSWAFQVAYRII
ncbi:Alpha-L-fucosidase [Hypsizygus marmoreus]|uniref:alpha-L-fucosidase n=1 Tax=Hypsizygus marmoreus TaxID=39966 RepID=A0A369JFU4_HYPMA|nr:Alpha-L-fucosidase [Hypsizygus marmoreus]